ncbi:hypothetical protein ACOME3_010159 [Neoechinorhynchus agilis]
MSPEYYASAPGRVNLIGEHIDYCGYSVLPMAIEKRIYAVGCKSTDKASSIRNTNPNFDTKNFTLSNLDITKEEHGWHKYVMCGIETVKQSFPDVQLAEMNVLFHGDIPLGCGLSSSSALVVCGALITLAINELTIEKAQLADMCAKCEKFVGTQGGGMDQAISCLANEGEASFISFNPLRVQSVKLPSNAVFVIANSCTACHKAATNQFNKRVAECRLASKMLAKFLSVTDDELKNIIKPIDVEKHYTEYTRDELLTKVKENLKPDSYSRDNVMSMLGINESELISILPENAASVECFQLRNRLIHVWEEASRVERFRDICTGKEASIHDLGKLMDQSHESCSKLYECSSDGLDSLVAICKQAGALGSRLTGAGWGGCNVSILKSEQTIPFLEVVKNKFYNNEVQQDNLLVTIPSRGAMMAKL